MAPTSSGPATQLQAPLAPASAPQLPVAAAAPEQRDTHIPMSRVESRTPSLVLGILLAVAAVSIVGAVVFMLMKGGEHHKAPTIGEAGTNAAPSPAVTIDEDAAMPADEQPFVPAPPLSPAPPLNPKYRHPDGGYKDACGGYKRLKERGDASAETLDRLEKACRASGGNP